MTMSISLLRIYYVTSLVHLNKKKIKPLATLSCDEANFLKMAAGLLDPTKAFMTGKLKIQGDMTMGRSHTVFFLGPEIYFKQ